MWLIGLKFGICVLIIFFMGRQVARYGDIIAHKTGLGGVWIGLILIALVTSLPELFNGISAVTIVGVPDLTIGNIFGANSYNLLNLAMLDLAYGKGFLLKNASGNHRITAWFSILLISVAALAIFISLRFSIPGLGWIGWYTPVLLIIYLLAVRYIFLAEQRQSHEPEEQIEKLEYAAMRNRHIYLHFSVSAALIVGAGFWLALLGDELSNATGLGASFIGSLLIGFTTTLPEITVSFAALRIGAIDLAVSNMIGSNLFNIIIIVIDDLLFFKGPVLSYVSPGSLSTAVIVVIMTLVFIAAVYFHPRKLFRLNWYNSITITLFLVAAYLSFTLTS
jgi:cation:H+ antiporter